MLFFFWHFKLLFLAFFFQKESWHHFNCWTYLFRWPFWGVLFIPGFELLHYNVLATHFDAVHWCLLRQSLVEPLGCSIYSYHYIWKLCGYYVFTYFFCLLVPSGTPVTPVTWHEDSHSLQVLLIVRLFICLFCIVSVTTLSLSLLTSCLRLYNFHLGH